jgi:iron complex outermembrane recepter protein
MRWVVASFDFTKAETQREKYLSDHPQNINMKYFLFFILQCFLQNISAQVSGNVVNAGGQAVSAANVLLLNGDSTSIKATLTNQDGTYLLHNISSGKYLLRISSTGYQSIETPAFEIINPQQPKDLGTTIMLADTKSLQEIIVRSEKPMLRQTAEGMIVNAESSLLTKGSNALQVLERSPGVVINRRDNSIELNGKSGVMVMLNGKLIRMSESQVLDLLAGMSGDDIATIELLTSPSAKYDAEGSAGLINIVLKKNKIKGTHGTLSLTTGYGYRKKAGTSFNLSHNTGNLNWYGSYNFSHNATYSNMYVNSWQHMPFLGGDVNAIGWDTTHVTLNNHNATIGMDAKLSTRTTVGGSILYSNNQSSGATNVHLGYNVLPDSLLQYDGRNAGMRRWSNIISSVYAERSFRPKEKLSGSMDYLYFNNNSPYEVHGTFVNKHGDQAGDDNALSAPAQKGFAHTTIRVAVGKLDYSGEPGKNSKLETGIKSSYTQSTSYSGFESFINGAWTNDPQAINHIRMKEGIAAAYVSFTKQLRPSISLVTGLRYEYAFNNMNDSKTGRKIVQRKFSSVFPSVFITKTINDVQELQLSYTKRITRASYNDLASYVGYNDPTAVFTGNPLLQPAVSHTIRLGYQYKKYAVSLLFSREENTISRYQLTESPQHNMLFISPQNISRQKHVTLQTSLPFKINDWYQTSWSFAGGLRQYRVTYTNQPFENTYFSYTVNHSQQFKLPHQFSAEVSASYNNANYNGTQRVEGIFRLNMGIKKELKNNWGSFQLAVTDILQQEQYNIHYGTLTQEAFNIHNQVIVYTESTRFPVIRLTYSRSFGSRTGSSSRGSGSGDEQERIRRE